MKLSLFKTQLLAMLWLISLTFIASANGYYQANNYGYYNYYPAPVYQQANNYGYSNYYPAPVYQQPPGYNLPDGYGYNNGYDNNYNNSYNKTYNRGYAPNYPVYAEPKLEEKTIVKTSVILPKKITALKTKKTVLKNTNTKDKKYQFIDRILPLIIKKNEQIVKLREKIKRKFSNAQTVDHLSKENKQWLHYISKQYRMSFNENDILKSKEELLKRIDIVVPALALAQAALESGWGKSRFSNEANNIFGIWTYEESKGLLPKKREEGKKHFIRLFTDYSDSISHYMYNLNTHPAYESFRTLRQNTVNVFDKDTSLILIDGLEKYSEQGQKYIDRIKNLIRTNKLIEISQQYVDKYNSKKNLIARR